jgi:hypothetical protein
MKKQIILPALLLMFLAVACGEAPQVMQGTVTSYDAGAKILVVKDVLTPHPDLTFSLQNAEFGNEPAVGDSVRLAYRNEGGNLVALRVMSLTPQKGSKKTGGH